MGTFKGLKSLDTCPPHWLDLFTKDCGECYRPMVPKRRTSANPTLLAWFVSAGGHAPDGTALCAGCLSRARRVAAGAVPTGRTAPPRRTPAARLCEAELTRMRTMVGACVECGWTPDSDHVITIAGTDALVPEPHEARSCRLAPRASTTRKMVA
jgi:hypothetical protein